MDATSTPKATIFEKIGGMPAVDAAVQIFYRRVLTDNDINVFFKHIDMETQSGKLKGFLAYVFGGPVNYTGKSMKEGHRHMQITEAQFDSVTGHLRDTLQELAVPMDIIGEVVLIAESVRDDIVHTSA